MSARLSRAELRRQYPTPERLGVAGRREWRHVLQVMNDGGFLRPAYRLSAEHYCRLTDRVAELEAVCRRRGPAAPVPETASGFTSDGEPAERRPAERRPVGELLEEFRAVLFDCAEAIGMTPAGSLQAVRNHRDPRAGWDYPAGQSTA